MDVKDLEQSFLEAKEYASASTRVISELQKKIQKLEDENKSLQLMLESNVPILHNVTEIGISPSRIICETQIAFLKNSAVTRELTLEESRKFQIYTDILEKLKAEKDDGVGAELTEEDLLKLVKNE